MAMRLVAINLNVVRARSKCSPSAAQPHDIPMAPTGLKAPLARPLQRNPKSISISENVLHSCEDEAALSTDAHKRSRCLKTTIGEELQI